MNYVDYPFESPTVLSFCPGILGLERGIERAIGKIRIAAYVEIEAFIIANLVAGMEAGLLDPAPIWTDAKTFDARPFRGKINWIIGGYPCPGESTAGLREGHLYKGFIWPYIRKAIAQTRPAGCFFENVSGHLSKSFPIVQRSLQNMGYAVEAGLFTAEEVGSPQERKRLFIMAFADDAKKRLSKQDFRQTLEIFWGCEEMGNSETERSQEHGSFALSSCSPQSIKERGRVQPGTTGAGTEMGNSVSTGLEKWQKQSARKECQAFKRAGGTLWPAGQGFFQHEWEPSRVEPSMVFDINGYNFREDLVRAIGNSVVEQTAELAFRTLLKKHFQ